MTRIYSAYAAAVDDHRRLFVTLFQCNSDGFGNRYFCDISSQAFAENKENICFPSFDCGGYGGCCGGLLYLHDITGQTVVLDPMRREFKFLPPSDVKRPADTNHSFYKACGLGFDSHSNDYKVVRFVSNYCREYYNDDDGSPGFTRCLDSHAEMYSLKSDSWKEIDSAFQGSVQGCGIYVNTKCYWIAYSSSSVISFDFEKESVSSPISLPTGMEMDIDCFRDIFEFKGSLAAIGYEREMSGWYQGFEAWILKEEDEHAQVVSMWEKVFAVKIGGVHKPLGFGKNGRLLFVEGNGEHEGYRLLVYDLVDGTLKKLPIFAHRSRDMKILSCSYDETTVPLPNANIFESYYQELISHYRRS